MIYTNAGEISAFIYLSIYLSGYDSDDYILLLFII